MKFNKWTVALASLGVVSLSSAGHRFSDVDLEDPNFEHTPYTEFGAYGRSKTANVLFAVEFDRRHKAGGVRAAAVSATTAPQNEHTSRLRRRRRLTPSSPDASLWRPVSARASL